MLIRMFQSSIWYVQNSSCVPNKLKKAVFFLINNSLAYSVVSKFSYAAD